MFVFNRKDGVKRFKITVSGSLIIYLTVLKKRLGENTIFSQPLVVFTNVRQITCSPTTGLVPKYG